MSTLELARDCARCAALCCVAPSFARSPDFAVDKPAGEPCPHLAPDHRCTIFADRAAHGFPACVGHECHGAGQRVTEAFGGRGSLALDEERAMHDAFFVVRGVHEVLALIVAAGGMPDAEPLGVPLAAMAHLLDQAASRAIHGDPGAAQTAVREARALLRRVGVLVATGRADATARSLPVLDEGGSPLRGGPRLPATARARSGTPRRRA